MEGRRAQGDRFWLGVMQNLPSVSATLGNSLSWRSSGQATTCWGRWGASVKHGGGRWVLGNDFQTVFKTNPFPQREASRGQQTKAEKPEESWAGLWSPIPLLPPPFQFET